jgi:hypothetical protein
MARKLRVEHTRTKGDPVKVALAARGRAETTMTVGWIAERLAMSTSGYLNITFTGGRGLVNSRQYQEPTPFWSDPFFQFLILIHAAPKALSGHGPQVEGRAHSDQGGSSEGGFGGLLAGIDDGDGGVDRRASGNGHARLSEPSLVPAEEAGQGVENTNILPSYGT